jgi:circadian clock protein KaiC
MLRLKQYFTGRNCTVLLLDDGTNASVDEQLQSLAHGVISLEQLPQGYGPERRRLRIAKLRGLKFRGGFHDYKIETGGVVVFPRLVAAEHRAHPPKGVVASGNRQLDQLLGGGLDRGTSTLVLGPSGSGKSTVMLQFAVAAARRGEHVSIYTFDEGVGTLLHRARAIGLDVDESLIRIRQVDPSELTPDELVQDIRDTVTRHGPGVFAIDSLNGYIHAMPDERFLTIQLHELLAFLAQKGATTILVMAQHGVVGPTMAVPIDVSYVADTVVLLRFFEALGHVKKAISVVKKRSGRHEDTIRELAFGTEGLVVGAPLERFRGVLTGVPVFGGDGGELARSRGGDGVR